ncbi:HAMP domain-containing protein [bacterium]|nr:HAMP domain-containing protein [bacterium]
MQKLASLFRSAAFPFMIAYVLFYGMSAAGLLWFVRSATLQEMERQIRLSIEIRMADVGRTFVLDGTRDTIESIQHLLARNVDRDTYILLLDKNWNVVAGNLDGWPLMDAKPSGLHVFYLNPNLPEDSPRILAIHTELPRGYRLLVGQSLEPLDRVAHTFRGVLVVSLWVCAAFGVMGGALFAFWIFRRLERINQTCASIMAGDLRRRVPVHGRHGDEFDRLGSHFNQMLDRIHELIDSIRDMSRSVAHDLRTPLNRLRNRLERLLDKNLPADVTKHLRMAIKEVDALVDTFNAILRISQAETGAAKEMFTLFDLRSGMMDALELYEALAETKDQTIRIDVPDKPVYYLGDQPLLTQAFANLLDNAIKYSPRETVIHVSLLRQDDRVILRVADKGKGVPEAYYTKLTQKFFRLDPSRNTPGNGLGLSLARAAVELHGGMLEFSDNQPGLIVDMVLPLS